ncbi:hypothetical protein J8F10_37190 [Gemmata sp. G18]|uniref:Motility protein B-like N-terminal domain-containing protein n=1 Tax=Gemmata palustris TaxID=2822762 RepID=A0ABS5C4H0_9BACT|nr:flagellar motor protein MotB [Gemmata palustris]MBP3960891.1 hypothetical protein [Gemmata palustris]
MAKGGGGSWKVAYADFVTAMMAFFLVMWIGAQDVKVRQSVANYFVDPSGVSKKPANAGAVLDSPVSGPVPENVKVEGGRGSRSPGGDVPSPSTAAVINWIKGDPKRYQHWKSEAQRCRVAANSQKAVNQTQSPEEVASNQLTSLLSTEVAGSIPKDTPDVYKDLLFGSFKEINWKQAAEVLLSE